MINKSLLVLAACLVMGCVHIKKPINDPSPPAAESNYATAEYQTRDLLGKNEVEMHYGLGDAYILIGDEYNNLNLKVQGYFDGVIKVDSGLCNISETTTYKSSELVPIKVPGVASRSCLIDIVVIPKFPGEELGVLTHEFKGQLMVHAVDGEYPWFVTNDNPRFGEEVSLHLESPFGDFGPPPMPAYFSVAGCGELEGYVDYDGDGVTLPLSAIVDLKSVRKCYLQGLAEIWGKSVFFTWRVWAHDANFTPLSKPKLAIKKSILSKKQKKISVAGNPSVTFVGLDNDWVFGSEASFKYDSTKPHTLRLLTIKGRSVICLWIPSEGEEWICRN